ncbi:Uncharacterised protein [Halioglobus japonicus]|nr:Uncharacterised protein [Halioglobus japonicus]
MSFKIHTPRYYLLTSVIAGLLASICIAAFCFIMDPYKMYPSVTGLSPETSVDLLFLMRLRTSHDVEHARPSTLIVGSSRSAALPPELLRQPPDIAYNASLPGAMLRDVRRMVEHAHAIEPLKKVFIGLEMPMFHKGASEESIFPDEPQRYRKMDPSLSERWQFAQQRIDDFWVSLFSIDALTDALTLLVSKSPSKFKVDDDGTWDLESLAPKRPLLGYRSIAQDYTLRAMLAKSVGIEFDELMELLDFTEENQISTVLLILPIQGLLMNTIEVADAWQLYLDWQRELVMQVGARHPDIEIYGVENLPMLTLEPVAASDRLFIDGVHLTRRAGIEILSCLADSCNTGLQPTRLDSQSINAYLDQVDAMRKQYARKNPEQVSTIPDWLKLDNEDGSGQNQWNDLPAFEWFR